MTLSYKDTQAFVGQDGKPSTSKLVVDTPNLYIKDDPAKNTRQIGNVYGHGSSLQTALNLSDVPDPAAAVANLHIVQGSPVVTLSDMFEPQEVMMIPGPIGPTGLQGPIGIPLCLEVQDPMEDIPLAPSLVAAGYGLNSIMSIQRSWMSI